MSQGRHAWRLRATTVGAAVALAVLVLAGCANSHPAGGGQQGAGGIETTTSAAPTGATVTTKTRVFAPYDRSGAPTAGVAARRSGSCFTTSITVSAKSAYRCFAGNAILDPCFAAHAAPHVLACYTAPWSRAVRLTVTAALPAASGAIHVARPWALELAGGLRCVVTNGTPTMLHGVALGYQCPDGWAGLLTTSGALRHALYQASDGAVRTLGVTAVWRAGT
jgi:hypothetical protein